MGSLGFVLSSPMIPPYAFALMTASDYLAMISATQPRRLLLLPIPANALMESGVCSDRAHTWSLGPASRTRHTYHSLRTNAAHLHEASPWSF